MKLNLGLSIGQRRGCSCAAVLALALAACRSVQESAVESLSLHPRSASPYPGPPTVTTLLLERSGGGFSLKAAQPRRDNLRAADIEQHLDAILAGEEEAFAYRLFGSDSTVLFEGEFLSPMGWRMTCIPPGGSRVLHAYAPGTISTLWVSVPYSATASRMEISSLVPSESVPPSRWPRTVVATLDLPSREAR